MNLDFLNKLSHEHEKQLISKQQPKEDRKNQQLFKGLNLNKIPQSINEHDIDCGQKDLEQPTLGKKLYPSYSDENIISRSSQFKLSQQPLSPIKLHSELPSQNLSPRRLPPSSTALSILKNLLKESQSSPQKLNNRQKSPQNQDNLSKPITKLLKKLIYLTRQKVQQKVYNYATSENRSQFVAGVMQVFENFSMPELSEQLELGKKGSGISSLNSAQLKMKLQKDGILQNNQYNPYINMGVLQVVNGIVEKICGEIKENTHYWIHRKPIMNKQDLQHLNRMDQHRLLYIKKTQKSLQQNLTQLRNQMEKSYSNKKRDLLQVTLQLNNDIIHPKSGRSQKNSNKLKKLAEIYSLDQALLENDKSYYSSKHPKTKQVVEFVERMKAQQRRGEEESKKRVDEQKRKYQRKMEKGEEDRKKAMQERHQRLKDEFQRKQILKMKESEIKALQDTKFQKYLKQYQTKKPLYVRMKQQYQEGAKSKQQERIQRKLHRRKQQHRPIDIEQLQNHQQNYLQQKCQYMARKQEEMFTMKNDLSMLEREMENLHKGRFHELIMNQMEEIKAKNMEDPLKEVREMKRKREEYGIKVKKMYQPKVDPVKRMESLRIVESRNRKEYTVRKAKTRLMYDNEGDTFILQNIHPRIVGNNRYQTDPQPDSKKDGLRNLRIVKQKVQQLRHRAQMTIPTQKTSIQMPHRSATLSPPPTQSLLPNYLQELKRQRMQRPRQSLDSRIQRQIKGSQGSNKDGGFLKVKAQEMDKRVRRHEIKLRNNYHTVEEGRQLEEEYLAVIKMKLELMERYH